MTNTKNEETELELPTLNEEFEETGTVLLDITNYCEALSKKYPNSTPSEFRRDFINLHKLLTNYDEDDGHPFDDED